MPQSYTCIHSHIIFGTKNRRPLIDDEWAGRLYSYFGAILEAERGVLIAAGGMPDHVHLLARLHPSTSTSDALRLLKTNSSKWIHETFRNLGGFGWQDGYAAFAVSYSNLESVRDYIANQKEHHRKRTFEDEFRKFVTTHGIPIDERYFQI